MSDNTVMDGRQRAGLQAPRGLVLLATASFLIITTIGLRSFGSLLSSFFLALVIVICVAPIRSWAHRKGWPGWLGLLMMFGAGIGVIAVVGFGVALAVLEFVNYVTADAFTVNMSGLTETVSDILTRVGLSDAQISNAAESFTESINLQSLAGQLVGLLSGVLGIASIVFTVILTMVFLTMDVSRFTTMFDTYVVPQRPNLGFALANFAQSTRRYFKVNTVFGLGVAVANVAVLFVLNIPLALVWGILSFLSSFIPNVGFVLGLIPPAILALAIFGPGRAIAVIVAYVVINTISDNGLKPKFVGDAVGLSATVTFMSLLFWAWVFGPVGALLAVPLTLFVRAVLVDSDPNGRWLQSLISLEEPDPVPDDAADVTEILAENKAAAQPDNA